jgi:hypothetical protein
MELINPDRVFLSPYWVLHSLDALKDAATPISSLLMNLHNTRVRRKASGFLQVAVSKARNPTVLVYTHC